MYAFAFSTLSFDSVPLPIVFISPALAWQQGLALNCSVCLAMSLLTHFRHKRYAVGSEWANYLGEETWATVNKVAKLQKEQLTPANAQTLIDTPHFLKELESMKKLLSEFKSMKKRLAALEDREQEAQQRARELEALSPRRKYPRSET
ncbi:hypothetical protein GBAR_LOCUS15039 [Geodia barretti]|uniref:Uncharacterized protein n=1 Tax=Geodia barretti TaxID=519541 RepID=A0AA35SCK7_GEOBA|nr:hypothetical protein GBAR_LOCUS15039 [Geodia barretti]